MTVVRENPVLPLGTNPFSFFSCCYYSPSDTMIIKRKKNYNYLSGAPVGAAAAPGNPAHREARGLTIARVVDGRASVLEILLLEGMPLELAGSVLAHELCHALFHAQH